MKRVAIILLPESLASSISLTSEMLIAADNMLRAQQRRRTPLTIDLVSNQPQVTTASGLTIASNADCDLTQHYDLVILPALWRNPLTTLRRHRWLNEWLQHHHQQGALLCAVGTGSFFLAEAGLLSHKAATTHWNYCDLFAERYPTIEVKRHFLITQAGSLYCAGSVNSVADLMVHLIANQYGADIAHRVEQQFSPEIRRPFEAHAYAEGSSELHHDELIIQAQSWLREQQSRDLQINELATQLGISSRSLNRRFKEATGLSPLKYLQHLRIESARELLRTTNLSVAEIAAAVGYQDASHFCRLFKTLQAQTPRDYRQAARGKLFSVT